MRTKDEILRDVGNTYLESPRSGIIPDLADVLMIEVLIDIRDILDKLMLELYRGLRSISKKD